MFGYLLGGVSVRVCNDTDTGIGIGETGISLPTPIPIRGIADMTILKKDTYYAFATAEEPLGPYLEVTEHTKQYLHNYVDVCIVGVILVLLLHIMIHTVYYFYEKTPKKTLICWIADQPRRP